MTEELDGRQEQALEASREISRFATYMEIVSTVYRCTPELLEDVGLTDATLSVWDPSVLAEVGDYVETIDILALFTRQLTEHLPRLAEAIETGVASTAHEIAHLLKGSAVVVGAARLAERFDAVCKATAPGATVGASLLESQLVRVLDETARAIAAHAGQMDSLGSVVMTSTGRGGR
jgi:HPt (histidine-containing phosphotransfer) domain-containing protein